MGTTAAFFDIDGTIFRNSLMIEHFRKLISFEIIDPEVWYTKVKKAYDEWERRYGDFEEYLEILAGVYLDELKGIKRDHVDYVANHVIETNWDMVYKYSRGQIDWHKSMGHKVFFISGSPDFLVSRMAEKYGATEYRGTEYFVDDDNRITGEIRRMWDSESKKKAVDEIISAHNVDLDSSYAYGDTTGDLSMLRRIGNPVAINPNKDLLTQIKEDRLLSSKTTIIVERKNVIYKCTPEVEVL